MVTSSSPSFSFSCFSFCDHHFIPSFRFRSTPSWHPDRLAQGVDRAAFQGRSQEFIQEGLDPRAEAPRPRRRRRWGRGEWGGDPLSCRLVSLDSGERRELPSGTEAEQLAHDCIQTGTCLPGTQSSYTIRYCMIQDTWE